MIQTLNLYGLMFESNLSNLFQMKLLNILSTGYYEYVRRLIYMKDISIEKTRIHFVTFCTGFLCYCLVA